MLIFGQLVEKKKIKRKHRIILINNSNTNSNSKNLKSAKHVSAESNSPLQEVLEASVAGAAKADDAINASDTKSDLIMEVESRKTGEPNVP